MNANEFQCDMCGGVFAKSRSDEEAMVETRAFFGAIDQSDCSVVCDTCFQLINPELHPELLEETKEELIRQRLAMN